MKTKKRTGSNKMALMVGIGMIVICLSASYSHDTIIQHTNNVVTYTRPINLENINFSDVKSWLSSIRAADENHNGISDSLEQKIQNVSKGMANGAKCSKTDGILSDLQGGSTTQETNNFTLDSIPIIVSFPKGNIDSIVSLFQELGGILKDKYDVAINGFAGRISSSQLTNFCSALRSNNVPFLVEEDSILHAELYYVSRNMNLRPYAWNTLGDKGDSNSAIAIIDTGIDASHAMFAPGYANANPAYKITGWIDEVGSQATPYDDHGHGSHCSGIVTGSSAPARDGSNRSVGTFGYGFDLTGSYMNQMLNITAARFNVTDPGTVSVDCQFDDYTPSDRVYGRAYLYHGNTLVDSNVVTSKSWTYTLTSTATSTSLGLYWLRIEIELYGSSGSCSNPYMRIRGIVHWPFNPPALGTANQWQGVAPDAHLVGVKVLDSQGSGSASNIVNGINWAITNKNTYNITVISMSLGGSAGQSSLISAVNNAVNSGIVTVIAAGNSGPGSNNVGSPGDADNVITVAAMSDSDHVTDYSSQGGTSYTGMTTKPDIMAPGGSRYNFTTFSADSNANDAEGYFTEGNVNDLAPMMGTSMATPAVAGAANLVIKALGGHQNWNYTGNEAKLVKALLLMTATETYPLQRENNPSYSPLLNRGTKDVHEGYGRINVDAAIEACTRDLTAVGSASAKLASSAVNSFEKHAIAGHAYFAAGTPYMITLDVPASADYDLYVYSSTPTSIGEPTIAASSTSAVLSQDETILFTPASSGVYYIVAKAVSGSGLAVLSVPPNNYAPTLTNPSFSPASGTQLTPFNFSIKYSDQDNNTPNSINLVINGTMYPLSKQITGDNNYTDGCMYSTAIYLQPGTYQYRFTCSDGRFTNSTSILTGPTVSSAGNTNAPTLGSGGVMPANGISQSTMFTYSVNYVDLDNNVPSYIRVTIDANTYSMIKQNASDTNYMDGCVYVYARTMTVGTHTYRFNCSDGTYVATTSTATGPFVIDDCGKVRLDNSRIGCIITHGEDNPITRFPDIITALQARGANVTAITTSITSSLLANFDVLWIHEYGTAMSSTEVTAITTWVTSGGRLLITGDEGGAVDPLLAAYSLSYSYSYPPSGYTSTIFPHAITNGVTQCYFGSPVSSIYTTSQPNAYVCCQDSGYDMIIAMNSSAGRLVAIEDEGFFDYYTYADNFKLINNTFGWLGFVPNNYAPTLTSYGVMPATGNQSTSFIFSATYTDLDNNVPRYMNVIINGVTKALVKVNPADNKFDDGCAYQLTLFLQPATYLYNFECFDGVYQTSTSQVSLTVTSTNIYAPRLLNPNVSPLAGNNATNFNFTVIYRDLDNNLPTSINITINNTTYNLVAANSQDTNAMDGKMYYFMTRLNWGYYRFRINCSDGKFKNSTSWTNAPEVNPFYSTSSGTIKNVAIFRNNFPWGYNVTEPRLVANGIKYRVFSSASLGVVSLAGYDKVIIESQQPTAFYDVLVQPAVRAWIESFVSAGGIFILNNFHWTSDSISGTLPGGYTEINNNIQDTMIINASQASNKLVANCTSAGLSSYNSAVMSYLTGMIGTEARIVYDSAIYQPRLFTRAFGNGMLIYNGLCVEWAVAHGYGTSLAFLNNLVRYAIPTTQFSKSDLLSPANNSIVFNGNVNFTWSSVVFPVGPVNYTMQLSNTSNFANIVLQVTSIPEHKTNTSTIVSLNVPTGIYYWRVQPVFQIFKGNWSSSFCLTIIHDDFAPALTGGQLAPNSGNQLTSFNFTVVYSDADNNWPFWVRVMINGTPYAMVKENISDNRYIIGVNYRCTTILPPGNYSYYFTCSDGKFTNTTAIYNGPSVVEINTHAPSLSSGQVNPSSGFNNLTLFNFTVLYTDVDNNRPGYVNISINWMIFSMIKANPADINYMDGCLYKFTTMLDATWNYVFCFNCSDRTYLASLGPFTGPTVNFDTGNWSRPWVGYYYDYGMATCTDGTYIYTVGYSESVGSGGYDMVLTKWDNAGTMIWNRTWGGTNTEYGYGAWTDGTYVYACGATYSYGSGYYDVALVKWDTNGNFQWYRTWGTSFYSEYGYAVTGYGSSIYVTGYQTTSYYDMILVKWDNNGNFQWEKSWGGSNYEYGYGAWTDGLNVYTCGATSSYGSGSYDVVLVKWDINGNVQWYRTWGTTYSDYGWGITGDGTNLYVGGYQSTSTGYTDAVLVKWDVNGNLQWSRTWGGTYYEYVYGICLLGNKLFLAGYTTSYGAGAEDILAVEYDTSGNFIKYFTWGSTSTDIGRGVCAMGGSIYICGYYYSSFNYYDIVLVKCCVTPAVSSIVLLSPPNGASFYCGNITFSWTSIRLLPTQINYTWQLSSTPTFSTITAQIQNIHGLVNITSMTTFINVSSGLYYWRVQPVHGASTGQWTSPFQLNLIRNFITPRLSVGGVSTLSGNQMTNFTFHVTYTDIENNPPLYVFTSINGTDYLMVKQNPADVNYVDGCIYVVSTRLQPGIYTFRFTCSDGMYTNSTTVFTGLRVILVNLFAPVLGNNHVTPAVGTETTNFNYTVSYYDGDNNAPAFMTIIIDSIAHSMTKMVPSDTNYVDGCTYSYTTTLAQGVHLYSFICSDGNFSATFGPVAGPTVTTTGGVPSDWGSCSLTGVRIGCVVAHSEYDPRSNYPTLISDLQQRGATVSGITTTITAAILSNYDLLWFYESGNAMSNSEISAIQLWVSNGGRFLVTGDGSGSGSSLLQAYSIYYGYYYFGSGYTSTIYPHAITTGVSELYYDYPYYYLDTSSQPSAYSCCQAYGYNLVIAMNSSAGRFVVISDDYLVYYYYISNNYRLINNTFGWLGYKGGENGGAYAPSLSAASVFPSTGDQATTFQFRVTYTDADNNAPVVMNVLINGTAYPMVKLIGTDNTYTDGCIYVLFTSLAPGDYEYQFVCSDGPHAVASIVYNGLHVGFTQNLPATLSSIAISPESGTTTTTFIFSLTYTDPENQAPVYIQILINGNPFNMTKIDVSDTMYSDGCNYQYSTLLLAGTYNCTFTCFDGYHVTMSNTFVGIRVFPGTSNSAPLLSIGQVSSNNQTNPATYTFKAEYQDADNDAPNYVHITINGVQYTMTKEVPNDYNYVDGCTYKFSIVLPQGNYSYFFTTSDGNHQTVTGTSNLVVESPQANQDTAFMTTIIVLALVTIGLAATLGIYAVMMRNKMKKANLASSSRVVPSFKEMPFPPTTKGLAKFKNGTKQVPDGSLLPPSPSSPVSSSTMMKTPEKSATSSPAFVGKDHASLTESKEKALELLDKPINEETSTPPENAEVGKDLESETTTGIAPAGPAPDELPASTRQENLLDIPDDQQLENMIRHLDTVKQPSTRSLSPIPIPRNLERMPAPSKKGIDIAIPTFVDMENTASTLQGAKPVQFDDKSIDIVNDIRANDLSIYAQRWYTGPDEGFVPYFRNEIIKPRMDLFGLETDQSVILQLVKHMINLIHGLEIPGESQETLQDSVKYLVDQGVIDINLPAPHLTDIGYMLRVVVLEMSKKQASDLMALDSL